MRVTRWRGAGGVAALVVMALLAGSACGSSGSSSSSGASGGGPSGAGSPEGTVSRASKDLVVSSDAPKRGGKIVYGLTAETNGWNPATNEWGPQGEMVSHELFDTLTAYAEDGSIHPNAAESFVPNADFTVWTVKMRAGMVFTNGKPVTAKAVVEAQQYFQTSQILSGAYVVFDRFDVVDELTFTITMKQPDALVPQSVASQIGVVVDPDWVKTNDSLHPVGTGAFVLDEWQPGNKLVVRRNPNYWRKDAAGNAYPYLDAIEYRIITDDNARREALRAGDIDAMQSFSGNQIIDFQTQEGFQVLTDPTAETDENLIMLNTQAAPFDDVDARRALAYATDRDAITQLATGGFDEPAEGPFAPSSKWYGPSGYPQHDPAKAKELVDKVKAAHGGQFTFTLTGFGDTATQAVKQALQQQWSDVGIDVKLDTSEQSALIINAVTGNYQAVTWFQFNYANPIADSAFWQPKIAYAPPKFTINFSRWKNDDMGTAISAAMATDSFEGQKAQWVKAQELMGSDVPFVWLYHQTVGIIASRRLVNLGVWKLPDGATGLILDQGSHPLWQVWLTDAA